MLEQYCCNDLVDVRTNVVEKYERPKIRLRTDKTEYPENPYKDFLVDYDFIYPTSSCIWGRRKRKMSYELARDWFDIYSSDLVSLFFLDLYGGNIEESMRKTEQFKYLWNQFLSWFDQKRRDFRMTFNIMDSKKQILENGKRPNSHGGVANLLKVLTKTMEKQGAGIENIAKVQYTICMQAGIYIPDEFMEDVAVALYVEHGENNGD